MLTYRAMVPGLCAAHIQYLARLLRQRRADAGCRWRKLSPARLALLVLVHLRCGSTYAELGFSFKVSAVTAYRYVGEAINVLAAQTPQLDEVMAGRRDQQTTILDGTIIAAQRVRCTSDHKAWYVYRKKTYGVNLQALTDHRGNLLWLSAGLPGSVHDLNAARTHDVIGCARRHDVKLLGDKGYVGEAPTVITPVKAEKGKDLLALHQEIQPRPRPPASSRRTRLRHLEDLAHPAQNPLHRHQDR